MVLFAIIMLALAISSGLIFICIIISEIYYKDSENEFCNCLNPKNDKGVFRMGDKCKKCNKKI